MFVCLGFFVVFLLLFAVAVVVVVVVALIEYTRNVCSTILKPLRNGFGTGVTLMRYIGAF